MDIKNKFMVPRKEIALFLVLAAIGSFLSSNQTVLGADLPATPNTTNAIMTDGKVYAMVRGSDGTTYIGGDFTWVGPISGVGGASRLNVAAIDTSGNIKDWNPSPNWAVYSLAASSSIIYIGGEFITVTDPIEGDLSRSKIAAISTDGRILDWDPNLNQTVYALAIDGATVFAGGRFTTINGVLRNKIVVALDSDGNPLDSWDAQVNGWEVDALIASGTTLYVGGGFTNIGGQARDNIAALNISNGNALSWNPGTSDFVYALALSGTTVYAGGSFTYAGGLSRNYLAAIDADGNVTSWDPSGTNEYEQVNALAIIGSNVYAGGSFTNLGGSNRNYIAAIDASSGNAVADWNPNADAEVRALLTDGSALYVGGDFTSIGGESRTGFAQFGDAAVVASAPTAPSGIATSSITASSIVISWNDNSSDETGFVVEKSTDGVTYTNVTVTSSDVVSLTIDSLSENTEYWFRVAARNGSGDSSYSTISSGTYTAFTPSVSGPTSSAPLSGTSIARRLENISTLILSNLPFTSNNQNENNNPTYVIDNTGEYETNKSEINVEPKTTDTIYNESPAASVENEKTNENQEIAVNNASESNSNTKKSPAETTQKQVPNSNQRSDFDTNFASGMIAFVIAPIILASQFVLSFSEISLLDFWAYLLRYVFSLLTLLGLRARRHYWGTVYDSRTKQPIDPAIVDLIDNATGKVLDQSVTDLYGRFGFLNKQGKYHITARKTHYIFPSQTVFGTNDYIFDNVYHGELIEISKPDDILVPNIPMDQVAFDWNQQEKQKIIKFHSTLEFTVQIILNILFWIGFLFVFFDFALKPNFLSGLFVAVYLVFIALRKFTPNRRLWGKVVSKKINTSGLLLEISPRKIPQVVVAKTTTAKGGKFFLKTSKGQYILRIKNGPNPSNIILESNVSVGRRGVLNNTINI